MVQSQNSHRPPLRRVLEAYTNVISATYTAKAGDRVIGVNRAGVVTVTLPTAEARKGPVYTVKDESGAATTNNITVATEGSETIDGTAINVISTNYGSVTCYSDGTNWFTVPLLAAPSVAYSATTGQCTDDHLAQAHQTAHNSAGADALKLDDLSAPDDNTDLNFSTTAHGLVPKGTNTDNFPKDDGTWSAPRGGGAVTREGGNTTEATTTSATAVDLLSVASLNIVAGAPVHLVFNARKSSGAAAAPAVGLKVNATTTCDPTLGAAAVWGSGAGNETQDGFSHLWIGSRISNYDNAYGGTRGTRTSSTGSHVTAAVQQEASKTAKSPTATVTDLDLRGISDGTITLGIDEYHIYSYAVS